MDNEILILCGEAILLASMQFAIGSVEMSSKFSVRNFSKDQETLQNAADALADYLRIGIMWTIGVTVLFYAKHGKTGGLIALMINILIIAWIYYSYIVAFKYATKTYNLNEPTVNILNFS
jgi:hypothetical protein